MKYLPLKFHVFYIAFTLLVSFFGPKEYLNYNKVIVLFFMAAYLIFFIIGFKQGINKTPKSVLFGKKININKFFKISIIITLFFYLINVVYLYLSNKLNFSLSIGKNYNDYYSYYDVKTEGTLFTFEILFLVLVAVPKYISLILGAFYYKYLSNRFKIYFIFLLSLIIITQTVSIGNQKSLGDIVIFMTIAFVVRSFEYTKQKRKKILRRVLYVFLAMTLLFSYSQYNRFSSRDISLSIVNNQMFDYAQFDLKHPVFEILGSELGFGVSSFVTGYLSNGYYGLSLCLQMPFEWSYGFGNSVSLTKIFEEMLDVQIFEKTYLHRMELSHGVPSKSHWHTIFPWVASDIGFLGALLLFGKLAFLYGKTWKEVLLYKNPISLLFFSLLSIMFMFLPANNQIMHGFDYLIITFFISFLWLKYHSMFNNNKNV